MEWKLYPPQKDPQGIKPHWGLILFLYTIACSIALAIRTFSWPEGKHVDSTFLYYGIIIPIVIISIILSFIAMFASANSFYLDVRKNIADRKLYHIKKYAREYLTIAAWSTVAPVDDIALKMLKLEGEFPLGQKIPRKLELDDEFLMSRTQQLLEKLLKPISVKLRQHPDLNITCWMRGENESAKSDLIDVLARMNISCREENITPLDECPAYNLLADIIYQSGIIYHPLHLIIIADLHGDDSRYMENASAFFICENYIAQEKPEPVYLFQPLICEMELTKSVPVFLAAEQAKPAKTLWHTGLSKSEKYPLLNALSESKTGQDRLSLETSLGEYSASYQWLALAFASDAVMYGQGSQLVATSEKNRPALAILSSEIPKLPAEPEHSEVLTPIHYAFPAMVFSLMMLTFLVIASAEDLAIYLMIAGAVLVILVTFGLGFVLSKASADQAWSDMDDLI